MAEMWTRQMPPGNLVNRSAEPETLVRLSWLFLGDDNAPKATRLQVFARAVENRFRHRQRRKHHCRRLKNLQGNKARAQPSTGSHSDCSTEAHAVTQVPIYTALDDVVYSETASSILAY
jgi:hypothetical protein